MKVLLLGTPIGNAGSFRDIRPGKYAFYDFVPLAEYKVFGTGTLFVDFFNGLIETSHNILIDLGAIYEQLGPADADTKPTSGSEGGQRRSPL